MWFILGLIAIGLTLTNLVLYKMGKDYKLAMALALSFTALTVNSFYSILEQFVFSRDMSALEDIVPYVNKPMFVLIGISIGLNLLPIFIEYLRNKPKNLHN
jgi:putative flippase GtrA